MRAMFSNFKIRGTINQSGNAHDLSLFAISTYEHA